MPDIDKQTGQIHQPGCWAGLVWDEWAMPETLDFNFIYDPKRFQTMEGNAFQVFRKNSRKFPRRNPDWELEYRRVTNEECLDEAFISWLENKDRTVHDSSTILNYLQAGENRKVLVNKKSGEIYGFNIWDENYFYINYRYCFCQPLPFLSEYMRLLFYQDQEILQRNKLVNDGGILDDNSLYVFKKKLNPIEVRTIPTYERE